MAFKIQCKLNFCLKIVRTATCTDCTDCGKWSTRPNHSFRTEIFHRYIYMNISREIWMNQKNKQLDNGIAIRHTAHNKKKNVNIFHLQWNWDKGKISFFSFFFLFRRDATEEQPKVIMLMDSLAYRRSSTFDSPQFLAFLSIPSIYYYIRLYAWMRAGISNFSSLSLSLSALSSNQRMNRLLEYIFLMYVKELK